ncbi:MAG: hypothetical protein PHS57_09510 [Alphaproteobacteria bacterium]|nr:hypothetical protein [Alphaproteobacteria bacterium]
MKKHDFFLPFPRLFTHGGEDPFSSIPFQSSDFWGDEGFPDLASPVMWRAEAVSVMAEAACGRVPSSRRAKEENTVPSWLWQHSAQKGCSEVEVETDLRVIINRMVGSAAAKAWKLGLFTSERHARAFYDETRYALMQRSIAITPKVFSSWGLSWAYGLEEQPLPVLPENELGASSLSNAEIDTLIGSSKDVLAAPLWKRLFTFGNSGASTVSLRLCDIAADWHSSSPNPAQAAVDVMALRHDDGRVDLDALRHAVRLLVVLLDLQGRSDVSIGLANLSPLLLALGLAYDSDAGRAMAASIAALVTAECVATSAEISVLRGMSETFVSNREAVMRSLRNHRRAVYGDNNDYEKLSVLPAPLPLKNCPDLSLVAEAQRRWDEALSWAHAFGLRATCVTDLTVSPVLSLLMTSASQGLEPIRTLTEMKNDSEGSTVLSLHPAVFEAFSRLGYSRAVTMSAMQEIVGALSLRRAPFINATSLKARGLDDVALEKIEAYIPCVRSLRLAVTPWIVGEKYCRETLAIPSEKLKEPTFDLLNYLGFSEKDIAAADLHCYGHGTARQAKTIPLSHRPLFACGDEISAEARLRMAAAVQSFVSGDTDVSLRLPVEQSVLHGAEMTLAAWQAGLKSLTLTFDPALDEKLDSKALEKVAVRRIKASSHPLSSVAASPKRHSIERRTTAAGRKGSSLSRRTAR